MEKSKRIKEQIFRLCEKQYRKGFQHGFYACMDDEMTQDEVDDFRGRGISEDYKKVMYPQSKHKVSSLERLSPEMAMPDMVELERLLKGLA